GVHPRREGVDAVLMGGHRPFRDEHAVGAAVDRLHLDAGDVHSVQAGKVQEVLGGEVAQVFVVDEVERPVPEHGGQRRHFNHQRAVVGQQSLGGVEEGVDVVDMGEDVGGGDDL